MELTGNDLHLLTHTAISAAYQAGNLINRESKHETETISKSGGDTLASQVVTRVDHLAQELILSVLEPTCAMFDLALLTEESADDHQRLNKDYFWCIDPLDGTLPFIEGTSGYSVSIGLVSGGGEPVIGVVYDPTTETMYHAVKDTGAFINGVPWELNQSVKKKQHLTLICDRSFLQHSRFNEFKNELNQYASIKGYSGVNLISHGGAAMNAIWVLSNSPACYFKPSKRQAGGGSLWDYAASACIFNEIGAVVSDSSGELLDLNRSDSTFMNHRGIIYASDKDIHSHIISLLK